MTMANDANDTNDKSGSGNSASNNDSSSSPAGRLEAIWLKRVRKGPMDPRDRVRLIAGQGLDDDANLGKKRQVTILSAEQWQAVCRDLGEDIDPRIRRSNLMVSGIELAEPRGRALRIGDCRISISGETRPCPSIDNLHPGLRDALDPDWRGGIYGEVLDDGEIAVGDVVSWEA